MWLCGTGKGKQAMNRHERRKAKALSRRDQNHGPTVVAVHEAGHAVAKVLAIGELGYSIDEAITYIDMGSNEALVPSVDGKMMLHSQGVTYGPVFSKDIATASRELIQAYPSEDEMLLLQDAKAHEHFSQSVALGRAAGADIGKWFRARVFDAVTGSITEAIFTKRTFYDVWNGYQAENDRLSVVRDAKASGIAVNEIKSVIDRMAALAAYLMEKPEIWAAVLALASKLPAVGRMDGDQAVAIIAKALPASELTGMFTEALEHVTELEQEIRANQIVAVRTPDEKMDLTKGKELLQKFKDGDIGNGEILTYECRFPIFAETLWRAFGDGASQKS
jgi:hypothetical protein